ncbi:hypothetical protein EV121DRAFT_218451, partial [Schizophyllum commune]
HKFMHGTATSLHELRPRLRRNFANSAFTCSTFNNGPRAVTLPHRDVLNLAFGICAVYASGDYNADLGGHLILWDLKVIIRFPPGCTLIFPSALIRHSNIPIQGHEVRRSFTLFQPGHLSRWVYNKGATDKERHQHFTRADWEKYADDAHLRVQNALKMFPIIPR